MVAKTYKTAFQNLRTTRIGDAGEVIVREHLKGNGWDVFAPAFNAPYPCDGFVMRSNESGFEVCAFEVKTYPRSFAYPRTGVDLKDYHTYKQIIKTHRLTILFVDAFEQCLYALQFTDHHEKAILESGKAYFDLSIMKKVRDLTRAEIGSIGWQKSIHYTNVQKFFI